MEVKFRRFHRLLKKVYI